MLLVVAAAQLGMIPDVLVLGPQAGAGAHEVGPLDQHPVIEGPGVRLREPTSWFGNA